VENVDLYRVLQVDPQAETEVVEAAYRRLARKYHPDTREVAGNTTPRMQELNGAWAVLRDPERRADYDRTRASRLFAFPAAITTVPAAPPVTMPVSTPLPRCHTISRRRALMGLTGGALFVAGGLGLAGITAREYLGEQAHAVSPAPSLETIAALTQRARLAVGPLAGTLAYSATSGITNVERADAHIAVRDFIVEARFSVPYAAHEGQWDCGFLFRNVNPLNQYRLIVSSGGRYQFDLWKEGAISTVSHGAVTGLILDPAGYNDLRVFTDAAQTFFYLNSAFVAALDTGRHLVDGDIAVATALYNGDALPNRVIHYERFTVLSLEQPLPVRST